MKTLAYADKISSKERVLRTFRHDKTDRVPVNYHSNPGIDGKLKSYFGLKADDAAVTGISVISRLLRRIWKLYRSGRCRPRTILTIQGSRSLQAEQGIRRKCRWCRPRVHY
jgi:hypothetical protein